MIDYIHEKPIGAEKRAPIGFSDSTNRFDDERRAETGGEKFVVFFLCDKLYGVPTGEVAEVSPPLVIAALPNAPEWLSGLGNLRGNIIAVVNLPKIVGENPKVSTAKTKFVVLKSKNHEMPIAFPVDKLSEIVSGHDKKIEVPAENISSFVYGKFTHQSSVVHLIDCDKLLSFLTTNKS